MQEAWVWSLGQEDPPETEMATHSSILACQWTEDPGRLQSMGSQRIRHDLATKPPPFPQSYSVFLLIRCRHSVIQIYHPWQFSIRKHETIYILKGHAGFIQQFWEVGLKGNAFFVLQIRKHTVRAELFSISNMSLQFSSVTQSCPTLCDPMRQYARPPCPSPSPGVHSNSHPSSRWCHPATSSSVVPFSSCPQSLPPSEPFPVSQLSTWGSQSTGVSALAPVLPKNTQD